ncbi:MAG: hypothetical protein IT336_15945 [Thermomicrobiales bacterium]|nr:hypothetical protein [Thermomicrobiales bacterium]
MSFERIVETVRPRLLEVMDEPEFDLVVSDNGTELDITTDHWTLHLEGGGGFLAIDDEPAETPAYAAARRAVMTERVERALAAADRELDGAISSALTATGDPFSLDFVSALRGAIVE